jgi:hypothetical protein
MTIQPNQSVLDAILTQYGSLESALEFCIQNNIPFSLLPGAGTDYLHPVVDISYDATETKSYLQNKNIIIATSDTGVCGVVTGLSISDIEVHTAIASFIAGENAESLEWCMVEGADTLPSAPTHIISSGTTSIPLAVNPSTEYSFLIRSNCHGTYSAWRRFVFTTPPELFITIVFRPLMMHVSFSVGLPSPYYSMQWGIDTAAYSAYGFGPLPMVPLLQFTTKANWDAGLLPFPALTPYIYDVSGTGMLFHVPAPIFPGTVYLWYSNLGPAAACYYTDLGSNIAPCMPVVVFEHSMGVKKMMAQMICGLGYTLGGLFHLPITVAHSGDNVYFSIAEHRIKELIGGVWVNRTGPLNTGDTVNVAFTPGRHTIGIFTTYQSVGTLTPAAGPIAINAMVFNIADEE